MSKPPAHTIRYGLIKASIWENQTREGTRYSITIHRLFKNGDQWKESQRFGRDDLLLVAKVADESHSWIYEKSQRNDSRSPSEVKEAG